MLLLHTDLQYATASKCALQYAADSQHTTASKYALKRLLYTTVCGCFTVCCCFTLIHTASHCFRVRFTVCLCFTLCYWFILLYSMMLSHIDSQYATASKCTLQYTYCFTVCCWLYSMPVVDTASQYDVASI